MTGERTGAVAATAEATGIRPKEVEGRCCSRRAVAAGDAEVVADEVEAAAAAAAGIQDWHLDHATRLAGASSLRSVRVLPRRSASLSLLPALPPLQPSSSDISPRIASALRR